MPVSVPVSEKRFSNVVILTGMRPVTVWSELFACFMQHFRSYSAQRHSKQRKTKKQDFRIRQWSKKRRLTAVEMTQIDVNVEKATNPP